MQPCNINLPLPSPVVEQIEQSCGFKVVGGVPHSRNPALAESIAATVDPKPTLRQRAKLAVKAEAGRRIEARAAIWRQINMVREMALIAFIPPAQRTQAQIDRFQTLRTATDRIDSIRTASDAIEARLDAESDWTRLEAFEADKAAEWPS